MNRLAMRLIDRAHTLSRRRWIGRLVLGFSLFALIHASLQIIANLIQRYSHSLQISVLYFTPFFALIGAVFAMLYRRQTNAMPKTLSSVTSPGTLQSPTQFAGPLTFILTSVLLVFASAGMWMIFDAAIDVWTEWRTRNVDRQRVAALISEIAIATGCVPAAKLLKIGERPASLRPVLKYLRWMRLVDVSRKYATLKLSQHARRVIAKCG